MLVITTDGGAVRLIDGASGRVTVPADGVETVKIFCWDSMRTMKPLCEAKEAEIQ